MKKIYEKPSMETVKLQQQYAILTGSPDIYGLNNQLQEEEPPIIIGW
ncbi:MAG: hypothetical protein IJ888_03805 [Prevotella sp.]|nr:hypothetical protein [Prevotella sp.]